MKNLVYLLQSTRHLKEAAANQLEAGAPMSLARFTRKSPALYPHFYLGTTNYLYVWIFNIGKCI